MKTQISKDLKAKKQNAIRQLRAIEAIETAQLQNVHYPAIKKQYEGKYFKKRNTYGGNDKGWNLYVHVVEIKPEHVYFIGKNNEPTSHFSGWTFEFTSDKTLSISQEKSGYIHSLVGKEISKKEFMSAFNKEIAKLQALSV